MKVLFIHRSVGKHLIQHGHLRKLLKVKGIELDDYNNNNGVVTHSDGTTELGVITMPGNNTNPDNLTVFFNRWDKVLDGYDLIMIKSCYPNSHIKSTEHLEQIKDQYKDIIKAFNTHKKPLVVLTSPPLRPNFTDANEARRAAQLASWLAEQAKGNIHVFDFHKLLSELKGRNTGMLRKLYRHWLMPWDNHPNAKAHRTIAPQLVDFIAAIKV